MDLSSAHAIGTPGQKWGAQEKSAWRKQATIKRSYQDDAVTKIDALRSDFDVVQYGALSCDPDRYPLFAIKSRDWDRTKPAVLITGGVHGYETSGVHGALAFVQTQAKNYSRKFNILVAPCISPWGYETINRWNPLTIDPNRSFHADSPAEECAALIRLLEAQDAEVLVHLDLHETTDTDESEFRPALAARDGKEYVQGFVPDGFYVVGNSEDPQADFQRAIIESVRKVTHIAPPDADGKLIGTTLTQEGVINYPVKRIGLCAGVTSARYASTTEVYPDSPKVDDRECNLAQVAAVTGALDYITTRVLGSP
jgi:hypothetical protein